MKRRISEKMKNKRKGDQQDQEKTRGQPIQGLAKGVRTQGAATEYELCSKAGCVDGSCKLNTHLATESQPEKEEKYFYTCLIT